MPADQFEQRVKDAIIADVRRRLGTERGQSLSDVEIESALQEVEKPQSAREEGGRPGGGEVATTEHPRNIVDGGEDRLDDLRAERVALVKLLNAVEDGFAKRRDDLQVELVQLVELLNVLEDEFAKRRVDLVELLNVVDDAIAKVEKELPRAAQHLPF